MLEGITPPRSKKHVCKIATSMEELSATDSEILADAINDTRKWPAQTLSHELSKRGLPMSDMTILRHRKQTCACYREIG